MDNNFDFTMLRIGSAVLGIGINGGKDELKEDGMC